MTKNFKILKDFNVSKYHNEKIINSIESIENFLLENKDLKYCYKEASSAIVNILLEDFDDNVQFQFGNVIREIVARRGPSTIVEDALYNLKRIRNEDSHPQVLRSDIPYKITPDFSSVIEVLKNLWVVIKFFVKERNPETYSDKNDSEYNWDSKIYYENSKKGFSNNDLLENGSGPENIDTNLIQTKLITIFNLISSNASFLVPNYQREYNWSTSEVEIFLEDIKKCVTENKIKLHYLGSIALGVSDDEKILHIIDGQQRITTSLLIIRAAINYFAASKMTMPQELTKIEKSLASKYANSTAKYSRLEYIRKILKNDYSGDKSFQSSAALTNFKFIEKKFKKMEPSDFKEFYVAFNRKFVVSRVNFNSDLRDEIEIFENLNSKGTHLSDWDLIKNYIYKSVDTSLLLRSEDKIRDIISKFFVLEAAQFFGNKEDIKNEKIATFFKFYCRIFKKLEEGKTLVNSNKNVAQKSKILRTFSNLWPKNNGPAGKFQAVLEIKAALLEPARLFQLFCLLESKEYLESNSILSELKLHLENLAIKDVHFPLIMNCIYEHSDWQGHKIKAIADENMERLKLLIGDIDKYITRLLVVSNIGQSLSQIFDGCIDRNIAKSHKLFQAKIVTKPVINNYTLPSIEKFKDAVENKHNWQPECAKSFLRTLSWSKSKTNPVKNEIYKNPNLELIFPQKPMKDSQWFEDAAMPWEDYLNKIENHTRKIGNFLVVKNIKSKKIKDRAFISKKEFYKKYADDDLLKMNFDFLNTVNILEKAQFTFEDINQRSREMAKLVPLLYKLSFEN